jgi:hypothetical protein
MVSDNIGAVMPKEAEESVGRGFVRGWIGGVLEGEWYCW